MIEWKGAFQSESADKDVLAAEVDRIVAQSRLPEAALAKISRLTRTPPNLHSYRFALYFALAMKKESEPRDIRILDIGAFAGLFVAALSENGIRAEGIENDPDHIEIADTLGVRFIVGDAFRLDEYVGRDLYDIVTCINFIDPDVFEVSEEKILQLCAQCACVLAPGGYFLINPPGEMAFPRRKVLELGFVRCEREEQYCCGVLKMKRHLILKKAGGRDNAEGLT